MWSEDMTFPNGALCIHCMLHQVVGMCDCEFDNVHVGSESTALTCVIINMTNIMDIMNYIYFCIGSGRVYVKSKNSQHECAGGDVYSLHAMQGRWRVWWHISKYACGKCMNRIGMLNCRTD